MSAFLRDYSIVLTPQFVKHAGPMGSAPYHTFRQGVGRYETSTQSTLVPRPVSARKIES